MNFCRFIFSRMCAAVKKTYTSDSNVVNNNEVLLSTTAHLLSYVRYPGTLNVIR